MKQIMILFIFIMSIFFVYGCSKEKTSQENLPESTASVESDAGKNEKDIENTAKKNAEETSGNHAGHLCYEITDNMQIDAEVSGYEETVKVYEAVAKEFSVDTLSKYFLKDLSKVKKNDNPNGADLETEDGSALFVGKGYFNYSSGRSIEDIQYLIQGAYLSELDYQNRDGERIKKLEEQQVVKDTLEEVEKLYQPEKDESIELQNGVKLDAGKLLERQKLEIEKFDLQYDIDNGKYHKIDETMIPEDAYYLILGIRKDTVPVMGIQEPYVSTADEDMIYGNTYIEVIADATGIKRIRVTGAYSLTEKETAAVLPPEEACNTIQKKYDMQILESEYVIPGFGWNMFLYRMRR